ncbi:alpha-amylase family glycosyl hydrolase [Mangrovicoccus algicola]|uniref:Alpha-glucosidase n=1 Tax=Mangrovicoccus algicola TaxID=2771008 RepID=A0A8J6YSC5_9RHOB|nr:alpha-amylase family glycosyl hydrolase [Mangrovicoccus algicola]MBE3636812.1 alpha-glucosidase [Mangrovicoccus algicola]
MTGGKAGTQWWRSAVLYQVYPRSFQDDDGDGMGDLKGITRRLEHVAGLGCDGIWLSPFFRSPMADMGYDVSDYTDVDPLFGTLADFDGLIARANTLGLKIIIDQVLNHTSDRHAWFRESRSSRTNPKADWYIWAEPREDGSPPNNWPSVFGGPAWTWDGERQQYYMHSFLSQQPDLNYRNPEVVDAVMDTMRFWLDRGVSGFRVDACNHMTKDDRLRDNPPKAFPAGERKPFNHYDWQLQVYSKSRPENLDLLRRMRAVAEEYDDIMLVGEVGDVDRAIELMGEYTSGEDKLHMAYSFDMLGPKYTPEHFRKVIQGFRDGAPEGWPLWSMSNHDVVRHVTRWAGRDAGEDALARQAISLLTSFEGAICLWQGEELGQTQTDLDYEELTDPMGLRFWPADKGRDGCRTPMVWEAAAPHGGFSAVAPWLPVKPPQAARAVDAQAGQGGSMLEAYRTAIAHRKATPALHSGPMHILAAEDPLFRFTRGTGAERLDCIYNLDRGTITVPCPDPCAISGPAQAATLSGDMLTLGPNGWAHLRKI